MKKKYMSISVVLALGVVITIMPLNAMTPIPPSGNYNDSICLGCDEARDSLVPLLLMITLPIIVILGIFINVSKWFKKDKEKE